MSYKDLVSGEIERVELIMKQLMEGLFFVNNAPLSSFVSKVSENDDTNGLLGKEIETSILVASEKQMLYLQKCNGNYTAEVLYHFHSNDHCTAIKLMSVENVVYALGACERYVVLSNVNDKTEQKIVTVPSVDDLGNRVKINSLDVFQPLNLKMHGKMIVNCTNRGIFALTLDELLNDDLYKLNNNHLLYSSTSQGKSPLRVVASINNIYVSESNKVLMFEGNTLEIKDEFNCQEQITALAVTSEGKLWYGTEFGSLYCDGVRTGNFKSRSAVKKIEFITENKVEKMMFTVHGENKGIVWEEKEGGYLIASPNGFRGEYVDFAVKDNKLYVLDKFSLCCVDKNPGRNNATRIFSSSDKLHFIDTLGVL